MKKLLLGSAALLMFSCSVIIFQISCKKEATAQVVNNLSSKIIFQKTPHLGGYDETWIADSDGSNATLINLQVPGWRVNNLKLSPDANKIYFNGIDSSMIGVGLYTDIFNADIDGSNVQQLTHDNASGLSCILQDVK